MFNLSIGENINLALVLITFAGLIIQWKSHKQAKLEFENKITSIEEIVFRLESEKKDREFGDRDVFRYTSDLDNVSRKARLSSHSILTYDVAAMSLIISMVTEYLSETQTLTDDGKLLFDSMVKACKSISARSDVSSRWSDDYSKLLDQDPRFLSIKKIDELNQWHDQEIKKVLEAYGNTSDHLAIGLRVLKSNSLGTTPYSSTATTSRTASPPSSS